jgi:hypothetical protein
MNARLKIWLFLMGFAIVADRLNNPQLIVWSIAVVGLFVVVSWRKYRQRVRQWHIDNRVCTRCEYDLRGIESDRCPECGEPISRSHPDSAGRAG